MNSYQKLCINQDGIRFKDIGLLIISNSWNLLSNIVLLLPRLPDMVEKCFCTPDRSMDPTFKIKYISSRFVFNLTEILIIKQIPLFFRHPVQNPFNNLKIISDPEWQKNEKKYFPQRGGGGGGELVNKKYTMIFSHITFYSVYQLQNLETCVEVLFSPALTVIYPCKTVSSLKN